MNVEKIRNLLASRDAAMWSVFYDHELEADALTRMDEEWAAELLAKRDRSAKARAANARYMALAE